MSDEQLTLTLKDAAEQLFRLRLQAQTERLNAPSELRKQRRLIARVSTIQTQRVAKTVAAAPATVPAPTPTAKPAAAKPITAKAAAAPAAPQTKDKKDKK